MRNHSIRTPNPCGVSVLLLGLGLAACAQLPPSIKGLNWQDRWGDRGEQVLARDYAMCQELVEQHRSLLTACMNNRGWYWEDGR